MRTILLLTMTVLLSARTLPEITLSGKLGCAAGGVPWHSRSLLGKMHLIIYMDPGLHTEAMPFLRALDARHYPRRAYSTIAVVNLADTWMPDAILESLLAKQSRKLYSTRFVFDCQKALLGPWKLADHACNLILVDRRGKILYRYRGIPDSRLSEKIFTLIRTHL